jgi:hypothetical protein
VALISVLAGKINSLDVSPVEVLGELAIWDGISIRVLLAELSSLSPCLLEVRMLFEYLFFLIKVRFGLNLGQNS